MALILGGSPVLHTCALSPCMLWKCWIIAGNYFKIILIRRRRCWRSSAVSVTPRTTQKAVKCSWEIRWSLPALKIIKSVQRGALRSSMHLFKSDPWILMSVSHLWLNLDSVSDKSFTPKQIKYPISLTLWRIFMFFFSFFLCLFGCFPSFFFPAQVSGH